MTKQEFFLAMLRSAVTQQQMGQYPMTPYEYSAMMEMAEKQRVQGLIIECLISNQVKLQKKCVIHMMKIKNSLEAENRKLNKRAVELGKIFEDAGFRYCIIKGQGNTLLYPNPMSRLPGDIDIWPLAPREELRDFIMRTCPETTDGPAHAEYPIFKDVLVEVHYKPSVFLGVKKYDKRLQQWFLDEAEAQMSHWVSLPETEGLIAIPTHEFNVIHQLSHIMKHFFTEGIGLRQLVDYYYVLKSADHSISYTDTLKRLGMKKFARGLMWVEKEIFHLDEKFFIVEADEKIGKLILSEIMAGGNFGSYDERYTSRSKGLLARGLTDVYRLLHFLPSFPLETLGTIADKTILNWRWTMR